MDINEIVKEVTKNVIAQAGAVSVSPAGNDKSYAHYIDHTILEPGAGKAALKKFCDEAKQYQFASVCVNPVNVPFVSSQLKGSGVKTCSVIGFPMGATTSFVKAAETMEAVKNGAEEVDMVINIGALKDKEYDVVYNDILAVVNAARPKAIVKVIIETGVLTNEEKIAACTLAKRAGADFVKTSTGFGAGGGATVEDVRLMKQTVGDGVKVKASAGIRDRQASDAMLKAGAARIGSSQGMKIIANEADVKPDDCEKCGKCRSNCPSGVVTLTKQAY